MKKYYILLGILGVLTGYFFKSNFLFEDEREIYFPITKEQLRVKKNKTEPVLQTASDEQSTSTQ